MKKIILHSFSGILCFVMITSCGKDVKSPAERPASSAKPTSSPVTQTTPAQNQNTHTCGGGQSGSSSNESSTSSSQGY